MLRERDNFCIEWSGKGSLRRWHLIDKREGFGWISERKTFPTEVSSNSKALR